MSAARELVKRGKAALTTSVDGHTHIVMLEDYEGLPLKSGYTDHAGGHLHPWIVRDDGTIVIGEQHGHVHEVEATSKIIRKHNAGDELREILKCASVITKAVGGHGHILSVADGAGALLTGGLTARSADPGHPPHVHPWIIDKRGRIVVGQAEGHAHAIDDADATALLRKIVKGVVAAAELGVPTEIPEALLSLGREVEFDFTNTTAEEQRAAQRRNAMRRDRAEREAALDPAPNHRSLADLDTALEARAGELATDDETMVAAFSRLVSARGSARDDVFAALLDERERVARLGAGYLGAVGE